MGHHLSLFLFSFVPAELGSPATFFFFLPWRSATQKVFPPPPLLVVRSPPLVVVAQNPFQQSSLPPFLRSTKLGAPSAVCFLPFIISPLSRGFWPARKQGFFLFFANIRRASSPPFAVSSRVTPLPVQPRRPRSFQALSRHFAAMPLQRRALFGQKIAVCLFPSWFET